MDATSFVIGTAVGVAVAVPAVWSLARRAGASAEVELRVAQGERDTLREERSKLEAALTEERGERLTQANLAAQAQATERATRENAEGLRSDLSINVRAREATQQELEALRVVAATAAARTEEAIQSRDLTISALKQQMEEARAAMDKAFGEASEKALNEATGRFLDLAKGQFENEQTRVKERTEAEQKAMRELLDPMHKELDALEKLTHDTGKENAARLGELKGQIESISKTSESLVNALKKPQMRGSWGEGQLIAILESSGWTRGQNFEIQDSTEADGKTLRTDVVVTLPRGRKIIIDSKAPLDSYLAATEAATDDERQRKHLEHARAVRGHVKTLASKDYASRYPGSPPYVILFLPYEGAYQIACEHDRALLDDAHRSRIILANPMTLMNLVHLATYVLNEERLQQNAEEVRTHAKALCERLGKALDHMGKLGRNLRLAAESYNELTRSIDSRLVPAANRIRELGAGGDAPLVSPESVDIAIRPMLLFDPAEAALPGVGGE